MPDYKPTVIFDFDGVIHSYESGWQGVDVIPDPPVPGIREAIDNIREAGYRVVILSTRCHQEDGRKAIGEWIDKHNIKVDDIVEHKIPAILQVDDRCICFDGKVDELVDKIEKFKTWQEK